MAARDKFHQSVRNALEKDGWNITHDPLKIEYGDVDFEIDLAAERVLGAERNGKKIAVEIKSFLNPSALTDFYSALGQFLSYKMALKETEPERLLYLAIPNDAFETFFQTEFAKKAAKKHKLLLIVYDPKKEVLFRWIK